MVNKSLLIISLGLLLASNGFSQKITNVDPSEGEQGQNLSVTISGQNTHFGPASQTTLYFTQGSQSVNPIMPQVLTVKNNTTIIAEFSFSHYYDTGMYDITYTGYNPYVYYSEQNVFELKPDPTPPKLTNIDPNVGKAGNSLTVTISGENTNFDQGTSTYAALMESKNNVSVQASHLNVSSDSAANTYFSFPSSLSGGFYGFIFYNSATQNYIYEPNSFFIENGGTSLPKIQSVSKDTLIRDNTFGFTVKTSHYNLYEFPTQTAFLKKGDSVIYANKVATLGKQSLETTFGIPANADTGYYSLTLLFGGEFEIMSDSAIYVDKEAESTHIEPEAESKLPLTIFPNPFEDEFELKLEAPETMHLKADLINTSGQKVRALFSHRVDKGQKISQKVVIDKELPAGSYFLKVTSNTHPSYNKVIKLLKSN